MLYDLDADRLTFSMRTSLHGTQLEILCAMRPYSDEEIFDLLRRTQGSLRDGEGGAVDILPAGQQAEQEFVDAHLIEASQVKRWTDPDTKTENFAFAVLTPDQVNRLSARTGLKSALVAHGYRGLSAGEGYSQPEAEDGLDALLEAPHADAIMKLWNMETRKEEDIKTQHFFRAPTAADGINWRRRLISQRVDDKTLRVQVNHQLVNGLYGGMIESVTGFVQETASTNKPAWVPKVPYLMKWFALSQAFEETSKNA